MCRGIKAVPSFKLRRRTNLEAKCRAALYMAVLYGTRLNSSGQRDLPRLAQLCKGFGQRKHNIRPSPRGIALSTRDADLMIVNELKLLTPVVSLVLKGKRPGSFVLAQHRNDCLQPVRAELCQVRSGVGRVYQVMRAKLTLFLCIQIKCERHRQPQEGGASKQPSSFHKSGAIITRTGRIDLQLTPTRSTFLNCAFGGAREQRERRIAAGRAGTQKMFAIFHRHGAGKEVTLNEVAA